MPRRERVIVRSTSFWTISAMLDCWPAVWVVMLCLTQVTPRRGGVVTRPHSDAGRRQYATT